MADPTLKIVLDVIDKASAGLKTASSGIENFGKKLQGITPVTAGVAAGVGAMAGISIKAASDMNEQVARAGNVFGESASEVLKFSETSLKGFGIAKGEAIEYANKMGAVLTASGKSSELAAEMSVRMVQLAGDMASAADVPIVEALEKLQAGLVGETEPLREMGVLLSEGAVAGEAFALGFGDAEGNLTEGEKVMARYSLVLQQTSAMHDDFAETSGSVANQMRFAKGSMSELAAIAGTTLIPILAQLLGIITPIIKAVADWMKKHEGLMKILGPIVLAIGGLMAVLVGLGVIIGPLIVSFGLLAGAVGIAAGVFTTVIIPLLPLIAILAAVGVAAYLLWKNWDTIWAGIKSTAETVWGFLKETWEMVWGTIVETAQAIWGWIQENWKLLLGIFMPAALPFLLLWQHWDEVWGAIKDTFNTVSETIISAWNTVKDSLVSAWNTLAEVAQAVFGVIKEIIEILLLPAFIAIGLAWMAAQETIVPAWYFLRDVATEVFQAIHDFIVPIFETIRDTVIAIWEEISSFLTETWNTIANLATEVFGVVSENIQTAWNTVRDLTLEVWNTIRDLLVGIWNELSALASSVFSTIQTTITNVTNQIRDALVTTWNEISGFLTTIWNAISTIASEVWNRIWSIISEIIIRIVGFIVSVLNPIVNVIQVVWGPLQGFFEGVFNGIRDVVQTAIDAVISKINDAIDKAREIMGVMGDVINWVGKAIDKIGSFLGKAAEVGKDIAGGQHGGTITQGGLIRVGEAGPELVALPRGSTIFPHGQGSASISSGGRGGASINGGGPSVHLHLEGSTITGLDNIEAVFSRLLRDALRHGGFSDLLPISVNRIYR